MSIGAFKIIDPWPDVPNRSKIRILDRDLGGVTGLMPRQVSVGFTNQWNPAIGSIARSFNTGLKAAQEAVLGANNVDYTLDFKELSNQIWEGTSSMSTELKLMYISRKNDALTDVIDPIKLILQLCGPTVSEKGLGRTEGRIVPGGRVISATQLKQPRTFMLELGYAMAWRRTIPNSVSIVFSNISDQFGTPTRADVSLRLTTDEPYVVDDPDVIVQSDSWQAVTIT